MGKKLYVDDNDIHVSRSSFIIYPNESIKYEGRSSKLKISDLIIMLQRRPAIMDALAYKILEVIYKFQFITSRQVTEYLNINENIDITQKKVSSKLHTLVKLNILNQYSYISPANEEGTNMKVYSIDKNAQILLNARQFKCDWKYTDSLEMIYSKAHLIRNQYILKILSECNNIKDLKIKSPSTGIGAVYTLNSNTHILVPIRNYPDYESRLLQTYQNISTDLDCISSNKRIILLGEDVNFSFNVFKFLLSKKDNNDKSLLSNTYFCTDLRLYDRPIDKIFFNFLCRRIENQNKIDVTMKDINIEDFDIKS